MLMGLGKPSNRSILVIALSQILVLHFLFDFCSAKNVSAVFIFGDSLVDSGNNLFLNTAAKPEPPNGIDFGKRGPSGRYTNGKTVADIVELELDFKSFAPPFLDPTASGVAVMEGVNYASSGSGILNNTGSFYGAHITMEEQIDNFAMTRRDIMSKIGAQAGRRLFRKALYVVATGSNDVMTAEMMLTRNISTMDTYLDLVISTFRSQLTNLYKLDARKIVVTGAGSVGCIPFEIDLHGSSSDGCITSANLIAEIFNNRLRTLLMELTTELPGSKFVYVDIYNILLDLVQNYRYYGFEIADYACCHVAGPHGGLLPCMAISQVCDNRTKYLFWDPFHLTENANYISAKHMMDGDSKYVSPINVRQLVNS